MIETCPGCKQTHDGFEPRPEQQRAFWSCRRCYAKLITFKRGEQWISEEIPLHGPGMEDFWQTQNVLEKFRIFVHIPIHYAIIQAAEDAIDRQDYFKRLAALKS